MSFLTITYMFFCIAFTFFAAASVSGMLPCIMLATAFLTAASIKSKYIPAIMCTVISALLITYFFGLSNVAATSLLVLASSLGLVIPIYKKCSLKTILLSGCIGYIILIVGFYFVYGGNYIVDMIEIAKESIISQFDSITGSPLVEFDPQNIRQIKDVYLQLFSIMKTIAPSMLLAVIGLMSLFSLQIGKLLTIKESVWTEIRPFSQIRANTFFLVLNGFAYMGSTAETPFVSGLMTNLLFLSLIFFTLCGYSLFDFLLRKKVKKTGVRICIIIVITAVLYLFSSIIPYANPFILAMITGIMDSFFNYRMRWALRAGK